MLAEKDRLLSVAPLGLFRIFNSWLTHQMLSNNSGLGHTKTSAVAANSLLVHQIIIATALASECLMASEC